MLPLDINKLKIYSFTQTFPSKRNTLPRCMGFPQIWGIEVPQHSGSALPTVAEAAVGGGRTASRDSPRGVSPSRFLAPGPRKSGFAQVRGHRVQPWTFEWVLFRVWGQLHAMVKAPLLCGQLW